MRQKKKFNDDAEEMGSTENSLGHVLEEMVEIRKGKVKGRGDM
jgi:hypothetical protein